MFKKFKVNVEKFYTESDKTCWVESSFGKDLSGQYIFSESDFRKVVDKEIETTTEAIETHRWFGGISKQNSTPVVEMQDDLGNRAYIQLNCCNAKVMIVIDFIDC